MLFRTKKRSSRYDIPSQNYIKNKINAKLLPHPLSHVTDQKRVSIYIEYNPYEGATIEET